MSVAALDLDLEVFQGPFDLLLTLVLNEEIDLLEVDLADVVLAYVEHLERAGELDLEAATEFLVLIAALLELKSRLMLPSDGDEEALDLVPGRGRRRAARADGRVPPLPRRGGAPARAARGRARAPLPLGAVAAAAAPRGARDRRACLRARAAGRGDRRAAADPAAASTSATCGGPRCRWSSACATSATCWARAGASPSTTPCAGADRLTEAVTLFALLELYKAGRGQAGSRRCRSGPSR